MRKGLSLLVLALVTGCDGADPFSGPVEMLVDPTTNNQTARAAEADSLNSTVDVVLWRGKRTGRIQFVTPLYAQTAVDGAPVVGGLVNSVGIGDIQLEAWNPAALTGEDGKARFWYEQGTRAGVACAEVRYADGDTRLVTDTACAVVEPGPTMQARLSMPEEDRYVAGGDSLVLRELPWAGRDSYSNLTDASDLFAAPDSMVTWAWEDGVSGGGGPVCTPAEVNTAGTGWVVYVPDFAAECYTSYGGRYTGRLTVIIGAVSGQGVNFYQPE